MNWDLILQITGTAIGLVYLWYEYHANARVWLVSVIMPVISMWLYFRKGLYADFAINIYYVAIAVYGYLKWTFKPKSENSKPSLAISKASLPILLECIGAGVLFWAAIYWILVTFTDSTVPVADAFTTALSIVGLWMMARKYVEQWIAWMIVDAVCVALYIYKGIPFYAFLYAVYTIVAIFGYRKWLKQIIQSKC